MSDFRSFAGIEEPEGGEILLPPDESHHLVRVNRARPGDKVIVFNGRGREWICRISNSDRQKTCLEVQSTRESPPPPGPIALAQALPKGKNFEQIVRKATELGVRKIFPILTSHTEVRLNGNRIAAKAGKWIATAIEAAKQCGNSYLPEIAPVQSFDEFLEISANFDLKLIASLESESDRLSTILDNRKEKPASSLWMIGPEGDFSPNEYQAAKNAGFSPVSLGPLVLRCETAAIAALSILSYELQNR